MGVDPEAGAAVGVRVLGVVGRPGSSDPRCVPPVAVLPLVLLVVVVDMLSPLSELAAAVSESVPLCRTSFYSSRSSRLIGVMFRRGAKG